jgi:hypothetical protein
MALRKWTRITFHDVVLEWLRAERKTQLEVRLALIMPAPIWSAGLTKLLEEPNTKDAEENRARLRLLCMYRNANVMEIPPDTEWYLVQTLTDRELKKLYVFNHSNFRNPGDLNELGKVAARMAPIALTCPPDKWSERPVLLGHHKRGPFTILEGNHRLISYAQSERAGLDVSVLIGLSPMRCCLNVLDECGPIMQPIFQTT